jgi:hypothetical protein
MDLVYVYAGPPDPGFEKQILALVPGAKTKRRSPGMGGLTEVVLWLADGGDAGAVERLRSQPRIIDASRGSLGEGV